ncbi:hypothetical protein [Peptostreptococcus faecalis]|uniref:hypothetical protein n=1 Tax=Peptostreptococcus faecalis TaxID=2045015 RepID=UPI0015E079C5|nr:hypothetical protein [Peptostreptococcus faecalis]
MVPLYQVGEFIIFNNHLFRIFECVIEKGVLEKRIRYEVNGVYVYEKTIDHEATRVFNK